MIILGLTSPVLHKNICSWYSSDSPRQDASDEYSHDTFLWTNKKNYNRIIVKYSSLISPLFVLGSYQQGNRSACDGMQSSQSLCRSSAKTLVDAVPMSVKIWTNLHCCTG